MSLRLILDGIAAEWCSFTHGGGHIERDPLGRVNWQCNKCGRWADPVPLVDEAALIDSHVSGVKEVHAPSLPLNVKRALDIAEGRLMTLDAMNHPAIPRNDDVLAVIREALASGVTACDGDQHD